MRKPNDLNYLLFIFPALLYVGYFSFYPAARAVYLSFQTPHSHFVLVNYKSLLYYGLSSAVLNTVALTVGALLIQLAIGLGAASILLREFRGKRVFSALVIIPMGVATVVAAVTFSFIFPPPPGGYANALLALLHLPQFNWYANTLASLFTVMVADSWKNTPIVTLILLAGMSGVSPDLYRAAEIDGAGAVRRFIHITLPNIRGSIAVALIIRGVSEFNIFALPLVLVGYRIPLLTTLTYEFYSSASIGDYYYSLASATILLAFVAAFILVVLKLGGGRR